MTTIEAAASQIRAFKTNSLRDRVKGLEKQFTGADGVSAAALCSQDEITDSLVAAALLIKRESSQINEVVHAAGILITLPHILLPDEKIEYLSLAASNTGRPFDLETNMRVAEFKFIDWKGGPESIRQNQLFKDFYYLAESDTAKKRYLYVLGLDYPVKFLQGGRDLNSVLSKEVKLLEKFKAQYGTRFARVGDFYKYRQDQVQIVDLADIVPVFKKMQTLGGEHD